MYQNQKDYCEQNNISISTKKTDLEYTKRIGFLSGTYVQLASPEYHIDEIIKEMKLQDCSIDIKKRFTYEHNSRSKVLSIYAVQDEADEIDEVLCKIQSPRYRYLSYRRAILEERLAVMHHNDVKNIKTHFEILYGVNLKDEVWDTVNDCYAILEQVLMNEKNENNPLFLAVE